MKRGRMLASGGAMRKTKKADSSMTLQAVGVILFIGGLAVLFYFPLGTVIGFIVTILVSGLGYSSSGGRR